MALRLTHLAALLAAGLLALSGAHAWRQSVYDPADYEDSPLLHPAYIQPREVDPLPEPDRTCAIYHARFGGNRARLVKLMRGQVLNYVVLEVPRRNPSMSSIQRNWLRAAYSEMEPVLLGEFNSVEAALAKAATLCEPSLRCRHDAPDCGPNDRPFTIVPGL
jgi:hypothetical protein